MHCKIDTKILVQIAEGAARQVCKEERYIENNRMRAIARTYSRRLLASSEMSVKMRVIAEEVCQEMLLVEYKKREIASQELCEEEKWTINEDNILKAELAAFFTATARKHERSHGAIVSRIKQINERKF